MSSEGGTWGGVDYTPPNPRMDVTVTPPSGLNISPYALDPSYLPKGPEFVFPVGVSQRSWNEKMFERIGVSYMGGLVVGGVWGVSDGVRRMEGTTRLRLNAVLNGVTRRGPFLANTLGTLTLMYSPLESGIQQLRGGEEDPLNSVAAAVITGIAYKSTAGFRAMGIAGGVGCAVVGAYVLVNYARGNYGRSVGQYT